MSTIIPAPIIYETNNCPPLTPEQTKEIERLNEIKAENIYKILVNPHFWLFFTLSISVLIVVYILVSNYVKRKNKKYYEELFK